VVADLEETRRQLLERGLRWGRSEGPFEEVARIADLVAFYPKKVEITIDGERLEEAPVQNVISQV
jgi:hypothetical protein